MENTRYFDSKVLSRQHAEVWEEGGKVSGRGVCVLPVETADVLGGVRYLSRTSKA